MLDQQVKRTNPLAVIGMLAVFALAVGWLVPGALSGDLGWFMGGVSEQPSKITIWSNGTPTTIEMSDPDYAPITAAVNEAIGHIYASSDFGPSPTTVADYRQSFSIEVFYDKPLQIHSRYNLGHPRQIMVPLTSTGYTEGRFFVGAEDAYRAAGPLTKGLPPVRAAVAAALTHHGMAAPTADATNR